MNRNHHLLYRVFKRERSVSRKGFKNRSSGNKIFTGNQIFLQNIIIIIIIIIEIIITIPFKGCLLYTSSDSASEESKNPIKLNYYIF